MHLPRSLRLPCPLPILLLSGALAAPLGARGLDDEEGPHDVPVDEFHPAREEAATPAYGGEVVVHLSSMPEGLNRAIEIGRAHV